MNDELLKRMMPAMVAQMDAEMTAHGERQRAWDIFVASLRDYAHKFDYTAVLLELTDAHDGYWARGVVPLRDEIAQFAEGYGWPDTLRAIAAAMQADEQVRREAMDRR
jgi:hypothetical protein